MLPMWSSHASVAILAARWDSDRQASKILLWLREEDRVGLIRWVRYQIFVWYWAYRTFPIVWKAVFIWGQDENDLEAMNDFLHKMYPLETKQWDDAIKKLTESSNGHA